MVEFPVARRFEKRARELHEQAKADGDPVYGIRLKRGKRRQH